MTLACDHVTLEVPGRVLVRGASFRAAPGEVWAVLGANGSGKTTLMHALAGLKARAAGAVRWDGRDPLGTPARARAREIGLLMQQEDAAFWGSTLEYVRLGRFPHMRSWFAWQREDGERAAAALDAVGLAQLAGQAYATLSGGERQRARIAQLLAQAPRLVLLDEPLQHLDLKHQAQALGLFGRLARDEGRTVVMVLHDTLWPGRTCTHALLMFAGGQTLAGPAEGVLTRENLERLYGCGLREVRGDGESYFMPHV